MEKRVSPPAWRTPTGWASLGSAVVIKFVGANPSHSPTRRSGFLVWHHGTCGYCADGGFVGPHAWIAASGRDPRRVPAKRRPSPPDRAREGAQWLPAQPRSSARAI